MSWYLDYDYDNMEVITSDEFIELLRENPKRDVPVSYRPIMLVDHLGSKTQCIMPVYRSTEGLEIEVGYSIPQFQFFLSDDENKYHLHLDNSMGLTRRINSSIEIGEIDGSRTVHQLMNDRYVGCGDKDDFLRIGRYAVSRIPQIHKEVICPNRLVGRDYPEEIIGDISLASKENVDWKKFTSYVGSEFFYLYRDALIEHQKFSPFDLPELLGEISALKSL